MDNREIVRIQSVEILRGGRVVSPIPTLSTLSSRHVGWNGIVLESFDDVPACAVPDHEHPTHFLNLQRAGQITFEWTTEGRTRMADAGPGTIYISPVGTRDRFIRSGPTDQVLLVMASDFLTRAQEETSHLADLELIPQWNIGDRHIASLMLALHADLEDGSPAGPLYGESLGVALAHYLARRYSVQTPREFRFKSGMPKIRLNRVLDFIRQNYAEEIRIWELAQVAGMSPHYFCELFKGSTGLSPHQYLLRCRIDRAKVLLRSRELSINEIAKATGFVDQSHFTKVFRRTVGYTPARFRQSL